MPPELLYHQNEFLIVAVLFALLLLAAETGFRRGRAIAAELAEGAKGPLTTLQGALAGLLALLLAFTFAMAVSRFEQRQSLVVDEANAIGTAELRARLLAEPYRSSAGDLLRKYIDVRLRVYEVLPGSPLWGAAEDQANELQRQLWQIATQTSIQNPNVVPSGMFTTALNELLDLQNKRDAVRANHVPEPALYLLFVVACLTMGLTGYICGASGQRYFGVMLAVAAAVSLTILAIIDLDRPLRGIVLIPQTNMLALRDHPM